MSADGAIAEAVRRQGHDLAQSVAAQAADRLNLALGRDGAWRGRCPCCGYAKPTLAIEAERSGIVISCAACGEAAAIAVIAGIPPEMLVAEPSTAAKVKRALELFDKAGTATGTPVEAYLRGTYDG